MFRKFKTDNYYASDLNKFIDEYCSHEMYCINIDCLLMKVSQKRIRFIEFKHTIEDYPKSEKSVLRTLRYLLTKNGEWKTEFFVVMGDPPFDITHIFDLDGNELKTFTSKIELISWLNFEKELS